MAGNKNTQGDRGGEAFRWSGNAFGRLVRAYRADRGWSQEELAQR